MILALMDADVGMVAEEFNEKGCGGIGTGGFVFESG